MQKLFTRKIVAVSALALLLSACGGHDEHGEHHGEVKAVDRVQTAQDAAMAKAPTPEAVTFNETMPPAPGAAGYVESTPSATDNATQNNAPSTDAPATDSATANSTVDSATDKK